MPNNVVRDEQLVVETSRDRMYGIISYIAPQNGGSLLDLSSVKRQIETKGIVFGIEDHAIKESFEQKKYGYKYIIAKGKLAVPGEAATLTFHFDHKAIGKKTPKKKEDGTVDFKELGLVMNTTKGALLVTKTPATEGVNGCNVLGQVVTAVKGKDLLMPRGKNTELTPDGLQLIAGMDGQLNYDGQKISISQNYIIQTTVDSSVGNINFIGNVVVNGGVQSGYTIQSGGNVEIRGSVEAATIIAEGDIILWYGIQGMDKGKLIAKGNIITKFIQNASVHADGDVICEAIMHSEVSAGANVMVDQGKGLIVGGRITAGKGIYTNTVGSYMATVTKIQLGQAPRLVEHYKCIEKKYFELKDKSFKTDQNVSYLKLKGINGLTPEKQQLLEQIMTLQQTLRDELQVTEQKYFELREAMSDADTGVIKVKNMVYPGVRVTIGSAIKYFIEEAQFCTISKVSGEITVGLY